MALFHDLLRPAHDRKIWRLIVETPWDEPVAPEAYETTDDHPWRTLDGRWLTTAEFRPGMLVARATGMPARVLAVADTGRVQATYNLEVADFHTYFVGEERVWVHNACRLSPDPKASGPHTTFRRDPSGRVSAYQSWTPNPRNPSGWDAGSRFRAEGKPHGGVQPPIMITPGGRATPALPSQTPSGW